MSKIFAGFLFVFLNFNLTLNQTYTVNLLPDFIGFLLLYLGTRELLEESPRYTAAGPWLLALTAYSLAVWVLNFLGISGGWVASLLTLAGAVASYYATWLVIKGFGDIENNNRVEIGAAQKHAKLENLRHPQYRGGGPFLGAGVKRPADAGNGGGHHYAAGQPQ